MRRIGLLVISAMAMSAVATHPLAAQNVTGKWILSVDLGDAGAGDATFVLQQDGNKLTGTYSGALGEADVTGTIEGNKFEFSFGMGGAGTVTYKGTVDGDTMEP